MKQIAYLVGALLIIASCNTEKRTERKARKEYGKIAKHDAKMHTKGNAFDTLHMRYCATEYPPKVSKGKTVYVKGERVTVHDTDIVIKYVPGETDTVFLTKYIRTTVHTTDTFKTRDTLIDNNELQLCQRREVEAMDLASKYKLKYEAEQEKSATRGRIILWENIILFVLIALYIVIKYYRLKIPFING